MSRRNKKSYEDVLDELKVLFDVKFNKKVFCKVKEPHYNLPKNTVFYGTYFECLKSYSNLYSLLGEPDIRYDRFTQEMSVERNGTLLRYYFRKAADRSLSSGDDIAQNMYNEIIRDVVLIRFRPEKDEENKQKEKPKDEEKFISIVIEINVI